MPSKELIKTKNIKKALKYFATTNLIPLSECDYEIIQIKTLFKNNAMQDFQYFNKEQLKLFTAEKLINEHIEFSQIYIINAKQKATQEINLVYSINLGKHATKPKIILSPNSTIPYKLYKPEELLKLLYKEFNKIKAFHGILITLFDDSMKKALKSFIKYISTKKFTKKITIPLFDGIDPIVAKESQTIFLFQQKRNKGMIIEVQADELLIKYIKPHYGRNGFNAFGKIIDDVYTIHNERLTIEVDPKSIRIEEDENTKCYYSKVKGYVHYDGHYLAVDNRLRLQEISRYKHILDSYSEENNIDIIITQNDINEDSIGEGVELVSESIEVEGFVGAKSKLQALKLTIKGATHQTSKQYAKFASINRHKGVLRCHEANIGLLEGGVVHASKVTIESSLGGEIYAEDVTIEHVKNNLKIYASNSITIRLVSGEDNLFEINYRKIPILQQRIQYIENEIADLKSKLKTIRDFKKDNNKENIQKEIDALKDEKKKIENSYKDASITIKEAFRGLNYIVFVIDQDHIIQYKTQNRFYEPFHLEIQNSTVTLFPPNISLPL